MHRLANWLRDRPLLIDVALVAVLVLCATGEFAWAVLAGWPPEVAWAWPVAVDCYAIQAFRARKDVPFAMLIIGSSVALAHVLGDQYPKGLPAWWTAGAGLAVPVIFWRIERLQGGIMQSRRVAVAEAQAAALREQEREDARRATAAQEVANRIEADRLQLERDQLEQRDRELGEQEAARKATEREQRRQQREPRPTVQTEQAGAEDILLPAARKAADRIRARGESVNRDRLRDQLIADGKLTGGRRNERAGVLLRQLREEERRAG